MQPRDVAIKLVEEEQRLIVFHKQMSSVGFDISGCTIMESELDLAICMVLDMDIERKIEGTEESVVGMVALAINPNAKAGDIVDNLIAWRDAGYPVD